MLLGAREAWWEIRRTLEFQVALLLFVVFAVGLGVLWLASKYR